MEQERTEHKKCALSGSCGEHIRWELIQNPEDQTNTLHLTGTGDICMFDSEKDTPWYPLRESVHSLEVSEGITSIGDNAFKNLPNLVKVSLPSSLDFIGNVAFSGCTALTECTVPEGVRILGQKCFNKCTSLTEIRLPKSVQIVDYKAFLGCDALKQVIYAGTAEEFDRIRVSISARGNLPFQNAILHCEGQTARYLDMTGQLKHLIQSGGDGKFHVAFPDLSVRNAPGKSGDCTLMVFPDGKTLLLDTGAPASRKRMLAFVRDIGLSRLDYFVISHPHSDHLGNALAVSKLIIEELGGTIGTYYSSGYNHKNLETPITDYLSEKGTVTSNQVRSGDCWKIGGVTIEILNPSEEELQRAPDGRDAAINNISILMKCHFGASTYLTSGDLYAAGERRLCQKYGDRLSADVAKTNHHGCHTSSTPEWIHAVSPSILLTNGDDSGTALFLERFFREGIRHYSVFDYGLTVLTIDTERHYQIETEFER